MQKWQWAGHTKTVWSLYNIKTKIGVKRHNN